MSKLSPVNSLLSDVEDEDDFNVARELVDSSNAPTDRYYAVYIICVLLGVGLLFPWNAWITPLDYFAAVFGPGFPFAFILSIVFNIATVTFLLLSVVYGERIPLTIRMMIVFVPFFLVMLIQPFVVYFSEDFNVRLGITLVFGFITGLSTAVGFGCIMGLVAQFPVEYTGAVMMGQGIAGVIVGTIRIVTKAAYVNSPVSADGCPGGIQASTLIYFELAAFIMFLCIVAYFVLLKLPFAKYHMAKAGNKISDSSHLLDQGGVAKPQIKTVLRKMWHIGIAVFLTFFVTLAMFPGMTSIIPSVNPDFGSWFIVIMIFIFQVGDFCGRTLPKFIRIIPAKLLWVVASGRVLFGVLFILCIVPLSHRIFASDWAAYIIMAVFAVTNGYTGTLSMMYGPDQVDDHEKALAGTIMSFFLNCGILSAVLFALFILWAVSPCDLPGFLRPAGQVCKILNVTCVLD